MERIDQETAFVLLIGFVMFALASAFRRHVKKLGRLVHPFLGGVGPRDDQMIVSEREGCIGGKKRVERMQSAGIQDRRAFTRGIEKARSGIEVGELDAELHELLMNSLFSRSVQEARTFLPENPQAAFTIGVLAKWKKRAVQR